MRQVAPMGLKNGMLTKKKVPQKGERVPPSSKKTLKVYGHAGRAPRGANEEISIKARALGGWGFQSSQKGSSLGG